jgi:hypothetical protein
MSIDMHTAFARFKEGWGGYTPAGTTGTAGFKSMTYSKNYGLIGTCTCLRYGFGGFGYGV